MSLNNYIAQNTIKGFNTISVESNWGARDWTGTALNNKNVFHSPVNSVWMWKSRSLLREQIHAGKVCKAPADCSHCLLSCFWWSFFSVDSPFLQQWLYHSWLTCMISASSSTKSGYDSVHWLLDFDPCPAPQQQKVPFSSLPGRTCHGGYERFLMLEYFGKGFFWPVLCLVAFSRVQNRVCALSFKKK